MHEATVLREENLKLRMLVALLHAQVNLSHLYLDDGEIQDGRAFPVIDFKRDSVEVIAYKIQQRKSNHDQQG